MSLPCVYDDSNPFGNPPTVLWVRTQPKSEIPFQSQLKLIEFYKPGTTLGTTPSASFYQHQSATSIF